MNDFDIDELFEQNRDACDVNDALRQKVLEKSVAAFNRAHTVGRRLRTIKIITVIFIVSAASFVFGRLSAPLPKTTNLATAQVHPEKPFSLTGGVIYRYQPDKEGFWQSKILAAMEPPARPDKPNAQSGRFWDKYTRYLKEKNYE